MVPDSVVTVQCLEVQNPPPAQRIDNKRGYIQIEVTKNLNQTIRYPDDVEPLPIHEDPEFDNAQEHDKIKNLCSHDDALSLVSSMLCRLEVPSDRLVRMEISRFVVETANEAITSSEPMKSFFVYVELQVNTEKFITKDSDGNDVDDTTSEDEDPDTTGDEETVSDGEDMDMPSHEENREIISDEEFTSDDDDTNMVVELSLDDAYETRKVGASRSAIDGLKRESYSYDDHTNNNAESITCVFCMDEFEAGMVVTYMPCSHMFHEDCLVRWLQENYSCPLCRLEIESCSSDESAV